MTRYTVTIKDFYSLKNMFKKLRYDTHLKTVTRKYYRGSKIWVCVYE